MIFRGYSLELLINDAPKTSQPHRRRWMEKRIAELKLENLISGRNQGK